MAKKPKKKTRIQKKKATRKKARKIKRPVQKVKKEKVFVIGTVTHYFPKVKAAVVKLKKPLVVGDTVLIKGSTTQLKQKIESMQIDHVAISKAKKGDEIGLKVKDRVREYDLLIVP